MINKVSSGFVPYRNVKNEREYLVLKSRTNDWEFPKGGVESDENLQETALRELEEETGIKNVKIINGFREDYSYDFYHDGSRIDKKVHLYICKVFDKSVELSNEHTDYQWRDFEQAKNTLTHESTVDILKKSHNYLDDKV